MNLLQRYQRLTIWNRLGTWGSIASIVSVPLAVVLAVASIAVPLWIAGRKSPPAIDMPRTTAQHEVPVKRRAPTVSFADGRRATVGFTVTTHIEDTDASTLVVTCGTEENARNSLDGRVLSSVIAQMEKRSLSEARGMRSQIGQDLVASLSPNFKKVGLTLDDISLTEITELNSGADR